MCLALRHAMATRTAKVSVMVRLTTTTVESVVEIAPLAGCAKMEMWIVLASVTVVLSRIRAASAGHMAPVAANLTFAQTALLTVLENVMELTSWTSVGCAAEQKLVLLTVSVMMMAPSTTAKGHAVVQRPSTFVAFAAGMAKRVHQITVRKAR